MDSMGPGMPGPFPLPGMGPGMGPMGMGMGMGAGMGMPDTQAQTSFDQMLHQLQANPTASQNKLLAHASPWYLY